MLLSRILGTVGRFCISLGVLTLLFVAYQLWGTGLLTAQAQDGLEDDFASLLDEAGVIDEGAVPTQAPAPTVDPDATAAEKAAAEAAAARAADEARAAAELDAAEQELLSNLLWQPEGDPVARLTIRAIDLEWTVVEGVETDSLSKGPGHYPSTPLPGMEGNAAIAGHRTTWGAPFNRIDELEPGDKIRVQTVQGVFRYQVIEQENGKGHFIVTPDRVDVLYQDNEEHPNRLTLTACHPKFSARQRIIVVAELIGEPAPFIPRPEALGELPDATLASEDVGTDADPADDGGLPGDPDLDGASAADDGTAPEVESPAEEPQDASTDDNDATAVPAVSGGSTDPTAGLDGSADGFGEGLNGDRSAILPSITWGLAAASIALAAGFVGRRWRRWPSYALAVWPFALVLFVCFVHIDQALPSY